MRFPTAFWLQVLHPRQAVSRRPWPLQTPSPSGAAAVAAPFATSACRAFKPMPPRPPPPPEDEIEEMFVKGSGPGGQKINKTNSAVQLIHRPTGIVVKSQATRSRTQNRNIARQVLAARLDELHNGTQSRTAIVADSKRRKKASASKKSRRKYRHLQEGENDDEEDEHQQQQQQQQQQDNAKGEQENKPAAATSTATAPPLP